eukprot:434202-Prymnesium_polylepis.1
MVQVPEAQLLGELDENSSRLAFVFAQSYGTAKDGLSCVAQGLYEVSAVAPGAIKLKPSTSAPAFGVQAYSQCTYGRAAENLTFWSGSLSTDGTELRLVDAAGCAS